MDFRQAKTVAIMIILTIPIVLATALLMQIAREPQSTCGNSLVEQDETPQSCCEDTGCLTNQACSNHSCSDLKCGRCEYAAYNRCNKLECCADSECGRNETCSENTNKCTQIKCECGYIENRKCVTYECCNSNECTSGRCNKNKCVVEASVSKQQTKPQQQIQPQPKPDLQPQQPSCIPTAEVCDGVDNNCNGLIDDGITCECIPGQTKSCGSNNIGLCKPGTQTCQTNHLWGSCTGQVEPSTEACDSKDNNCNGQTDEGSPCPSGQLCTNGNCKTVNTDYKVQPVIFFPSDYANDQDMVKYLNGKFEEIRQFYLTKAGTTFTMLQPQVVIGDHSHEWYWCSDGQAGCEANNFEANLVGELIAKGQMKGTWEKAAPDRVIWVAAFGGGGYAGGRHYPTGGGLAIVGDAGIYAAKDSSCTKVLDKYFSTDNHPNVKDACQNIWISSGKEEGFGIGALGHELGHTFDLPHPDGYTGTTTADWEKTIMGYHWNYPNTGLLYQDKTKLSQSPFFNTKS